MARVRDQISSAVYNKIHHEASWVRGGKEVATSGVNVIECFKA